MARKANCISIRKHHMCTGLKTASGGRFHSPTTPGSLLHQDPWGARLCPVFFLSRSQTPEVVPRSTVEGTNSSRKMVKMGCPRGTRQAKHIHMGTAKHLPGSGSNRCQRVREGVIWLPSPDIILSLRHMFICVFGFGMCLVPGGRSA